jgi:hypothetical protein
MKEDTMSEWQATQLFLSETGVHEVATNLDNAKLRCDCVSFRERSICKHTRFVSIRRSQNNGIYPVEVSKKASEHEASLASLDPKLFRPFLVKYGKIEIV